MLQSSKAAESYPMETSGMRSTSSGPEGDSEKSQQMHELMVRPHISIHQKTVVHAYKGLFNTRRPSQAHVQERSSARQHRRIPSCAPRTSNRLRAVGAYPECFAIYHVMSAQLLLKSLAAHLTDGV